GPCLGLGMPAWSPRSFQKQVGARPPDPNAPAWCHSGAMFGNTGRDPTDDARAKPPSFQGNRMQRHPTTRGDTPVRVLRI
ncbi:MAG: hypothetical protein VYB24_07885, partial [Pseudomonadota bacterium]|nr:hypothetical protein [Pseudomonadota bacterium]